MTDKREELIARATEAIYRSGEPGDPDWDNDTTVEQAEYYARVALAVFEQAHTPTDDKGVPTVVQISEVAVQRGYQTAIADMLWLAKGRGEYTGEEVQFQVRSVQQVARAMSGDEFTYQGWLPSWLWGQWEARRPGAWAPVNENGETDA